MLYLRYIAREIIFHTIHLYFKSTVEKFKIIEIKNRDF